MRRPQSSYGPRFVWLRWNVSRGWCGHIYLDRIQSVSCPHWRDDDVVLRVDADLAEGAHQLLTEIKPVQLDFLEALS